VVGSARFAAPHEANFGGTCLLGAQHILELTVCRGNSFSSRLRKSKYLRAIRVPGSFFPMILSRETV
jgi:hypothetical protein